MMASNDQTTINSVGVDLSNCFQQRHEAFELIECKIKDLFSDFSTFHSTLVEKETLEDRIKALLNELSSSLKEYYVTIVGLNRILEKAYLTPFDSYLEDSYPSVSLGFEDLNLNSTEVKTTQEFDIMKLIIAHLYRVGLFNVAESLEKVFYYDPLFRNLKF